MNLKRDIWSMLQETWADFNRDGASQLGAALAYYAMFSIFPLLLLLLAVLGWLLRYWDEAINVQKQILTVVAINFSSNFSQTLEQILSGIEQEAGSATGIGLLTLMIGASGVFQQLDSSFRIIWKVPQAQESSGWLASLISILRDRLFSFGMVIAVGFLLLVSLALTGITQATLSYMNYIPVIGETAGYIFVLLLALSVNALIFALLYRYLPATNVQWGDVWIGALLTALIWEIAKRLLALYINQSSYNSAYGAVGTVLVLMVWIYFSSQILFLGAEFTEVYSRRYGSRSPKPTPPMPEAEVIVESATVLRPQPAKGTVVMATGAGVLIGVVGSIIAAIVAVLIASYRAASGLRRTVRRVKIPWRSQPKV